MLVKNRKSNRLQGFNYSNSGYYFVTICTKNRIDYFGQIIDGKMILNKHGLIVKDVWKKIPEIYQGVKIDEYIIMPNHIHGIIINNVRAEQRSALTNKNYGLISKIIKSFKEAAVKNIHKNLNDYKFQWQRSFYDHIIRDEKGLNNIRQYIINNPRKEGLDKNNKTASSNKSIGQWGEDIAVKYLKKRNYQILERNYQNRYGEIDIICSDKKSIIFVEVKTRRSTFFGQPEEAIAIDKLKKIYRVALDFLKTYKPEQGVQIDAIAIKIEKNSKITLAHIKDIFIDNIVDTDLS